MNSNRRSMHFVIRISSAVLVAIWMMVPLAASAQSNVSNWGIKNFKHVFVIHDGEHKLHEPDWQSKCTLD